MKIHTGACSLWWLGLLSVLVCPLAARAQLAASGTINATLVNKNGIALIFDSNSNGVSLSGAGTSGASVNLGTISAYGALSPGIARTGVTPNAFTVRTLFDVNVTEGGLASASYTLSGQLSAPSAPGVTYEVDGNLLSTSARPLQTNGTYNADVQHNLSLVVSTAGPQVGGPAVGTSLRTTIDFVAIAN